MAGGREHQNADQEQPERGKAAGLTCAGEKSSSEYDECRDQRSKCEREFGSNVPSRQSGQLDCSTRITIGMCSLCRANTSAG